MKTFAHKRIFVAIFALFFAFPLFAQYFVDEANLVNENEKKEFESKLSNLDKMFGIPLFIVTTKDYSTYGSDVYDASENYYGKKINKENACLLFIAMNDRSYDFYSFGKLGETAFSHARRDKMEEPFLRYCGENRYSEGFRAVINKAEEGLIRYTKWGNRSDENINILIAVIVVSILISIIVVFFMFKKEKAKLSNVSFANQADYYANSQVQYSVVQDIFSHTTTHVTRHSSSNRGSSGESSGGGGSHHGGHF